MISRIRLDSFKSVGKPTQVELRPLTVLAGANSSGKSTLLQSILLLHQTMTSKVTGRAMVLNGPTVRLGSFDDVLTRGSRRSSFSIGIDLQPAPENRQLSDYRRESPSATARRTAIRALNGISIDLTFNGRKRGSTTQAESSERQIDLSKIRFLCEFTDAEGASRSATLSAAPPTSQQRKILADAMGENFIQQAVGPLKLRPRLDAASRQHLRATYDTSKTVGVEVEHFLPSALLVKVNVTLEGIGRAIEALLQLGARSSRAPEALVPFGAPLLSAIRETLGDPLASRLLGKAEQPNPRGWQRNLQTLSLKDRQMVRDRLRDNASILIEAAYALKPNEVPYEEYDLRYERLPQGLAEGAAQLDNFLTKRIRYLGPLRDEPRPVYPLSTSGDILDVGSKGEFTAAVLDINQDLQVVYLSPHDVAAGRYAAEPVTKPLVEAVGEWLTYIGVSEGVSTREMGSRGHELRVRVGGAGSLDLTQVGVGVSQVLPIIVMGLVAPHRSTVIFEQPELHLHPLVQTRLADFFVSMVYSGLQCVVETHSEYLINRLRLRSTAVESDLHERVAILFTEQDEMSVGYRPVELTQYGTIADWPQGFFDESQRESEAILLAGLAKRRERKLER